MLLTDRRVTAPLVFEDAGRVFRPDTCEPLKAAAMRGELELQGWARGNYPGQRIPGSTLPGVRSIGIWDAHKGQNWGLGEHCNEGLELMYVSRGQLSFRSSVHQTLLQAGDLTVTAPWLVHEVGLPHVEASRVIWVILDVGVRRPNQQWIWPEWVVLSEEEKKQLSEVIQATDRTVWPGRALSAHFEAVLGCIQTGGPGTSETDVKILVNSILLQLVRTLSREHEPPSDYRDASQETVRLFLNRLEEHVEYNWRVEEMAHQCGVSYSIFMTHCRDLLNRTPHAHLALLRIRRACNLLVDNKEATLTDIAMECGFSSSAHFSTAFRKEMGQTPSSFRRLGVKVDRGAVGSQDFVL